MVTTDETDAYPCRCCGLAPVRWIPPLVAVNKKRFPSPVTCRESRFSCHSIPKWQIMMSLLFGPFLILLDLPLLAPNPPQHPRRYCCALL